MNGAHRFIAAILLTTGLVVPVAIMAAPAPQASVSVRVYDSKHKDYHNWDDNENHAWGTYLTENHKKPHEFTRAPKKEKTQYWDWRHDHQDGKR